MDTPLRNAVQRFLVEHDGFHLLMDPGHGTMSRLVEYVAPEDVDAVLVTHGHADHCADLNPLLRARHLADDPPVALSVHAPSGALEALLSLDGPMLVDDWTLTDLSPDQKAVIGPFTVVTVELRISSRISRFGSASLAACSPTPAMRA